MTDFEVMAKMNASVADVTTDLAAATEKISALEARIAELEAENARGRSLFENEIKKSSKFRDLWDREMDERCKAEVELVAAQRRIIELEVENARLMGEKKIAESAIGPVEFELRAMKAKYCNLDYLLNRVGHKMIEETRIKERCQNRIKELQDELKRLKEKRRIVRLYPNFDED